MEEQDLYRTIIPVLMETDPEAVLDSTLDAVMDVSGAARGCLVIPTQDDIAIEFTRGRWKKDPQSNDRKVSRSILDQVISEGKTIVLDNALENPEFMHQQSVVDLKIMSVLAVPIWSLPRGPRPVAALYLDHPGKAAAFDDDARESIQTIADMLGPRIEQAWRYQRLRESEAELRRALASSGDKTLPVGNSPSFQRALTAVRQVAASDVPVLLLGESGTGKEVMARTVHEMSPFSRGPWVAINCGALPQELLESELFGHEKGAFTGADRARPGKIASAASGTLFLDEVGEMPMGCQTRFLRVLQTGEIQRVGSDRTMTVKVRVVAATNRDLRELIKEGLFREDLFYRLNVVPISLPPLMERGDDILLLAQKFVNDYARGAKRAVPKLDFKTINALLAYTWPGNVRELENAMRRALVFATGDSIMLEHLPPEISGQSEEASALAGSLARLSFLDPPLTKDGLDDAKKAAVREVELRYMRRALGASGGNLSRLARETGLNRAVIYDMLKRLEIDPADFREGLDPEEGPQS